MTTTASQRSAPQWHDLTEPHGNTTTARRVLGQFLAATLRTFVGFPLADVATHNRPLYARTVALVRAASASDLGAALSLFRLPTVSTLVHCVAGQMHPLGDHAVRNRWLRQLCQQILLELAVAHRLVEPVAVGPNQAGGYAQLATPTVNLAVAPTRACSQLRFANGVLTVDTPDGPLTIALDGTKREPSRHVAISHPYHEIVAGQWLSTFDNNPLAMVEAHPDKQGNALSLGGRAIDEWLAALRDALALIDTHLPLIGEEMRLIARVLVPVGYDAERHLSASYRESIGTVYMTLHPQMMTMAEALIHEFQHNKLNMALHLDPLLTNAWSPLYASPVRPDPRPLHGVILAVHAFQPVARLYEEMHKAGHPLADNAAWLQRYRKIVHLDRQGAATVLDHAQPTPVGKPFFAEIAQIDAHLAELELQLGSQGATQQGDFDELAGHD